MELKVLVAEKADGFVIDVPDDLIREADEFFDKMDRDMDGGIQMSRSWVEQPKLEQRVQNVAHKLLNAVAREDEPTSLMMAGYILSRVPDIEAVKVQDETDMLETELVRRGA